MVTLLEILRPPKVMASEHCALAELSGSISLASALGAKVGSFEPPGDQAHRRSLIVWRSPWSVVPLYPGAEIEEEFSKNIIDLDVRHRAVLAILRGPDYDRLLADFYREHPGAETKAELEEEIAEDRSHYICFNVADFIASLWTGEPFAYFLSLETTWTSLAKMEGVFQCECDTTSESHAFVIWNDGQTVRYYSGYGGFEGLMYGEFPAQRWFGLLRDAVGSRDNATRRKSLKDAFAMPPLFDELHPKSQPVWLKDEVSVVVLA